MRRKIFKNLLGVAIAMLVIAPAFAVALPVQATADDLLWGGTEAQVDTAIGLGDTDPREMVASIINVALGFLGIVAVVIILIGGFKWMTAGGNEDKVAEARKLIMAGIVGLVIILASWAIAKFVISALYTATGAG